MLSPKRLIFDLLRYYVFGTYRGQFSKRSSSRRYTTWREENFHYLGDEKQHNDWSNRKSPRLSKKGLFSWDYPVIHWIRLLELENGGLKVCDFGGANGVLYERFKNHLDIRRWYIHDLDHVEALVTSKYANSSIVEFTKHIENCDANVLMSYSAFQYIIDFDFNIFLNDLNNTTSYVIVNRIPVAYGGQLECYQCLEGNMSTQVWINPIEGYLKVDGWELLDLWYDDLDKTDRVLFTDDHVTYIGGIYKRKTR